MTERYVTQFPLPTPQERETLTILVEECSELITELADVQKRATKMLRFGRDEAQIGQGKTNADRLGNEAGDVLEMIERIKALGLTSEAAIEEGRASKRLKLHKYMQEQP